MGVDMSKLRVFAFIFFGSVIHFLLMVKVVYDRLVCDGQAACIGMLNRIAGRVLEFPLGSIMSGLDYAGFDVNLMRILGEAVIILDFMNSVLAVTLLWVFIVNPIFKRRQSRDLA